MFGWGNWKDVMVFYFGGYSYLLQGAKHKNGKTRFRIAHPKKDAAGVEGLSEAQLVAAGLWSGEQNDTSR